MLFFLLIVLGAANECIWVDPEGNKHDLGQLDKAGGWKVRDASNGMGMFNMVYVFNFCDYKDLKCEGKPAVAYEALEVMDQITENCDMVGIPANREIKHIDNDNPGKGFQMVVNDGDECLELNPDDTVSASQPRVGIFQVVCSDTDDENFKIVQGQGCTTIMAINHHIGCDTPVGGTSNLHVFFYLCLTLALYFGVGYTLNAKRDGTSGVDALPHKEFWLALPDNASIFFMGCVKSVFGFSKRLTQRNDYTIV